MADRSPDLQRSSDAAAVLPFAATVLLMPPFIGLFAHSGANHGIPLIVIYVFAVWAGIILAAFVLARRLGRPEPEPEPRREAPPPGGGAQ